MRGESGVVIVYMCVREKDRMGVLGLVRKKGIVGEKDINIKGVRGLCRSR